mgnify:CR=1 FL=1
MKKWIVEKIYHYSTALTSWSWTWLYGKRNVVAPKGMLRMSKTRVHYYKSLISFNKHHNIFFIKRSVNSNIYVNFVLIVF